MFMKIDDRTLYTIFVHAATPGRGYRRALMKEPQQHKLSAKIDETYSSETLV